MTIEKIKKIFDKKNVDIKIGYFFFENAKLKFNSVSVEGFDNKTKILYFKIRIETFMNLVDEVQVVLKKG